MQEPVAYPALQEGGIAMLAYCSPANCGFVVLRTHSFVRSCYFTYCSDDDEEEYITCGSAIKLSHYESGTQNPNVQYYMNSEGKNLGGGSGQQIVTAVTNPTTTNTLWWVRGPNDPELRKEKAACNDKGTADHIPCGSIIRLTHLNTMKNLHSHEVKSPLSRQQEVSGYGTGDGLGDNGDDWEVLCTTKYWKREGLVQFKHVDSGTFLGSSSTVKFTHQNCGHNCPILNHLEVFGRSQSDQFGKWLVEMGVHLSR
jgi:dolichyl-phosphate-mannose--protein O-mannosyl transferase